MREFEQVMALVERHDQLMRREREDCPGCGQKVAALRQVGRSIYAYPCGHRLGQGVVPPVWRTDPQRDDAL